MISFIVAIIVILLGYFIFILFLCLAKIIVFCKKKKYFKLFYESSAKSDTHSTFIFITLNEWIFIST